MRGGLGVVNRPGRAKRDWAKRGSSPKGRQHTPRTPGCADQSAIGTDYAKDVLVETQWVEDHLDDDSIRIVEVDENPGPLRLNRTFPAPSASTGRRTSRTRSGATSWDRRSSARSWAAAGSRTTTVIVLDGDRNNWFAAYTYWYFKFYGHENVKLINGPREKWISENRADHRGPALITGEAKFIVERGRTTRPRQGARRSATPLGSSTHLVHVRSPQEFSGELIAMPGYEQEGDGAVGATSPARRRCRGRRP